MCRSILFLRLGFKFYKPQMFISYRYMHARMHILNVLWLFSMKVYILMHAINKWHVALPNSIWLYSLSALTPANWWHWLKCCRVGIHLCACCHCISDQFKAGITGVGSSVTNGVASECHHAIYNICRIGTH